MPKTPALSLPTGAESNVWFKKLPLAADMEKGVKSTSRVVHHGRHEFFVSRSPKKGGLPVFIRGQTLHGICSSFQRSGLLRLPKWAHFP